MQKKLDGSSVVEQEEDLLDVRLRLHGKGDENFSLRLDNVKAVILDLFTAGTDTAASTLEWTKSELKTSPRALKKAQSEVGNVFGSHKSKLDENHISTEVHESSHQENFRLHPPVPLLLRESTRKILGCNFCLLLEAQRIFKVCRI